MSSSHGPFYFIFLIDPGGLMVCKPELGISGAPVGTWVRPVSDRGQKIIRCFWRSRSIPAATDLDDNVAGSLTPKYVF